MLDICWIFLCPLDTATSNHESIGCMHGCQVGSSVCMQNFHALSLRLFLLRRPVILFSVCQWKLKNEYKVWRQLGTNHRFWDLWSYISLYFCLYSSFIAPVPSLLIARGMDAQTSPLYTPFFGVMGAVSAVVFCGRSLNFLGDFSSTWRCLWNGKGWRWNMLHGSDAARIDYQVHHTCRYGGYCWYLRSRCGCACRPTTWCCKKYGQVRSQLCTLICHRSLYQLGAGLSVGLSGLGAGFAIGIVGDAGVRGTAQQARLFVGMVLILIFAEVLGLYGLIVALMLSTK